MTASEERAFKEGPLIQSDWCSYRGRNLGTQGHQGHGCTEERPSEDRVPRIDQGWDVGAQGAEDAQRGLSPEKGNT